MAQGMLRQRAHALQLDMVLKRIDEAMKEIKAVMTVLRRSGGGPSGKAAAGRDQVAGHLPLQGRAAPARTVDALQGIMPIVCMHASRQRVSGGAGAAAHGGLPLHGGARGRHRQRGQRQEHPGRRAHARLAG